MCLFHRWYGDRWRSLGSISSSFALCKIIRIHTYAMSAYQARLKFYEIPFRTGLLPIHPCVSMFILSNKIDNSFHQRYIEIALIFSITLAAPATFVDGALCNPAEMISFHIIGSYIFQCLIIWPETIFNWMANGRFVVTDWFVPRITSLEINTKFPDACSMMGMHSSSVQPG